MNKMNEVMESNAFEVKEVKSMFENANNVVLCQEKGLLK